jgi:hypothetical protein
MAYKKSWKCMELVLPRGMRRVNPLKGVTITVTQQIEGHSLTMQWHDKQHKSDVCVRLYSGYAARPRERVVTTAYDIDVTSWRTEAAFVVFGYINKVAYANARPRADFFEIWLLSAERCGAEIVYATDKVGYI